MLKKKPEFDWRRIFSFDGLAVLADLLAVVGTVGSLTISAYVSWHLLLSKPTDPQYESMAALSITNLLLLIFLFATIRSWRRQKRKREAAAIEIATLKGRAEANSALNQEASRQRALIARHHYFFCLTLRKFDSTSNKELLKKDLLIYMDRMLDCTANLFSTYTGHPCSACIKLLTKEKDRIVSPAPQKGVEEPPAWYAMTLRRDSASQAVRGYIDNTPKCSVYPCDLNAAFHSILRDTSGREFFIENDLRALRAKREYWNANPHWSTKYIATAVVPIKRPDRTPKEQCLGFLCVDNMGGGFDKNRCGYILEGISYDLYYTLRIALQLVGDAAAGETHV